jgi:uncharacterized protein (DUF1786 family)
VGNLVTLTSTGNWTFTNPASMTVYYVAVDHSQAANDIIAYDGSCVDNGNNNAHWLLVAGTAKIRVIYKSGSAAYLELQILGGSTSSFTVEADNLNENIGLIAVTGGSLPGGYSEVDADVGDHTLITDTIYNTKIAAAAGHTNYVTVDEFGKILKGAQAT